MLKDMSPADRSKERSIHLSISSGLPESFVTKRKSSVIKMAKISGIENQTAFTLSNTEDLVCKFLHSLCQSQQILPSYSGFILVDNDPTKSLTKIVHYPVIQKPITDSSTVQEAFAIFRRSFWWDWTINFWHYIWFRSLNELVRNSQEIYKNHIIMICTFHLIMAYFNVIGKMAGSGSSDVLLKQIWLQKVQWL